ncbi:hypothetical protein J2T13_000169 [Paenibacillus sp. DS2015]|uniref:hypothetical protein n=1 Tax=Paenibacillus sp. DS2015 TaxID=3373917 RepID=UPI003D240CEF
MTMTYTELFAELVTNVEETIRLRKNDESVRLSYVGEAYDVADRVDRMELIQRISDDYVSAHADVNHRAIDRWEDSGCKGERPVSISLNTALLDRLADAVLDEEITDPHPDKVTRDEYPFLSERQLNRRRDNEYSLSLAENYDTDGVNRGKPERRHRTARESRFIEKVSQAKNRRRNAQYKRDTSNGDVVSYNLRENGGELAESFVTAAEQADRWRELIVR